MKRNFPSFIEAFTDYTKHVGAPEKFIRWSAVSGVAACLERKTWIVHKATQHIFPNMYVFIVADSGIARKTTATTPITELLAEVPSVKQLATQMSTAALVMQIQQAGNEKEFEYAGEKYPNSSLFSYSSEASSTIGESKVLGDIQILLTDFYDCKKWSAISNWSKTLVGTGTQHLFNPCLNLLYCSTPQWLMESIGKRGIEGGFASRFIFVNQLTKYETDLSWVDEEDIPTDMSGYKAKLVEDLKIIAKIQGKYKVAKGFKEVYNSIAQSVLEKESNSGDMKAYYARKLWHCLKLAQILTADRTDELVIQPETLEEANNMLLALEPDMYKPFGSQTIDSIAVLIKLVWSYCMTRKRVTRGELLAFTMNKMKSTRPLDEVIQTLVAMGKIRLDLSTSPISYLVLSTTPLD